MANTTQVKHLLGSAAHAARAFELDANGTPEAATEDLDRAARLATPTVIDVLRQYPPAPAGGARPGALIRRLDTTLREAT